MNEYGHSERNFLRHTMRWYALIAPIIAWVGYQFKDKFLGVILWELTPSVPKIS